MRFRVWLVFAAIAVFVLGVVGQAAAFPESQGEPYGATTSIPLADCGNASCHPSFIFGGPQGPHFGYSSTTDKCVACHEVHESPAPAKLLRAATVTGLCNTCHDLSYVATGGRGVYGAIRARGGVAVSRHNIVGYNNTDTAPVDGSKSYVPTSTIPGGTTLVDDKGAETQLQCSSCHTPHGNTQITAFMSDRVRLLGFARFSSNKLLQDNPNGTPMGSYTGYGTQWCGVCHTRRHSAAPGIQNHPTNNSSTFGYADVTYTVSAGIPGPGLGGTNAGYTFDPVATPPAGNGKVMARQAPLCQQCHEDYRDVETVWNVANIDGNVAGDNPRWQTFPHESVGSDFNVETGDDLCLNCHSTENLP